MSYIEQVAKLLLKFPDYQFSSAYLRLRFNLTDREFEELHRVLPRAKIAYMENNKWILCYAARAFAKELENA